MRLSLPFLIQAALISAAHPIVGVVAEHPEEQSTDQSSASRNLRGESAQHRELTLSIPTEELTVLAEIGDQDLLNELYLSLDFDESNNIFSGLSQLQKAKNPNGNLMIRGQGLGPLFPWARSQATDIFSWTATTLFSRLTRPLWQGKLFEFTNGKDVRFINQYAGLRFWTGDVFPGTLAEAIVARGEPNPGTEMSLMPLIRPFQNTFSANPPTMKLDSKSSLILDYRDGDLRTPVMDECRPMEYSKLSTVLQKQGTAADELKDLNWEFLYLCRGTAPVFMYLGGDRVFILFFAFQLMPETITFNTTAREFPN